MNEKDSESAKELLQNAMREDVIDGTSKFDMFLEATSLPPLWSTASKNAEDGGYRHVREKGHNDL